MDGRHVKELLEEKDLGIIMQTINRILGMMKRAFTYNNTVI